MKDAKTAHDKKTKSDLKSDRKNVTKNVKTQASHSTKHESNTKHAANGAMTEGSQTVPSRAGEKEIKKLADLLRGLRIAMMTTLTDDGHLHTRPMATQTADFAGEFWFFTSDPSPKVREARHDARCNLSYMSESDQRYVTVSGIVEVVHDHDKMKDLWEPTLKAWFPKGLSDPHLCLLRVIPETAEYWDPPSSALVRLVGFAKATLTGKAYDHSNEHDIISLTGRSEAPKAGRGHNPQPH